MRQVRKEDPPVASGERSTRSASVLCGGRSPRPIAPSPSVTGEDRAGWTAGPPHPRPERLPQPGRLPLPPGEREKGTQSLPRPSTMGDAPIIPPSASVTGKSRGGWTVGPPHPRPERLPQPGRLPLPPGGERGKTTQSSPSPSVTGDGRGGVVHRQCRHAMHVAHPHPAAARVGGRTPRAFTPSPSVTGEGWGEGVKRAWSR